MSASSESENDSTQEVWEDSETPAEDWGDDEKTDWPVEGIVGEEVNTRGELLCVQTLDICYQYSPAQIRDSVGRLGTHQRK